MSMKRKIASAIVLRELARVRENPRKNFPTLVRRAKGWSVPASCTARPRIARVPVSPTSWAAKPQMEASIASYESKISPQLVRLSNIARTSSAARTFLP